MMGRGACRDASPPGTALGRVTVRLSVNLFVPVECRGIEPLQYGLQSRLAAKA
jgi:hypothetical protein